MKNFPRRSIILLTLLAGLAPAQVAQGLFAAVADPFSPPPRLPSAPTPLPPGPTPLPPGPGHSASPANGAAGRTATAPGNVAATLATARTIQAIRIATLPGRTNLAGEINARIAASRSFLGRLRQRAGAAGGQMQTVFEQRFADVSARETTLRTSLQTTVDTADVTAWPNAQTTLIASYQDYADAAQQTENALSPMVGP